VPEVNKLYFQQAVLYPLAKHTVLCWNMLLHCMYHMLKIMLV